MTIDEGISIKEILIRAFSEDQKVRMGNEFNKYKEINRNHIATLRPWLEKYGLAFKDQQEIYALL